SRIVGLLASKNLLNAHTLFLFRKVGMPCCCKNRSIVSAVWFSSLLNEGIRIRSRRRRVLSCINFSIIIKFSGFACRQFNPFDKRRAKSVVFHLIQSGNRASLGRGHIINLSLSMVLFLVVHVCSVFG